MALWDELCRSAAGEPRLRQLVRLPQRRRGPLHEQVRRIRRPLAHASAAIGEEGGDYSNYKYTAEALRIIRAHPPEKKLFLYMAYADVHGPIQAPDNYTALYAGISNKQRRLCLAMISAVDTSIGWIVDELTAQGMYDSTLILWSSDNGGPSDHGNVCRGAA